MTDVLSPLTTTTGGPSVRGGVGRGVGVSAVLGALGAAAAVIAASVAVSLAGWFAADAGRYGQSTDAVRVGADAWLLAHGAGLSVPGATVTLMPLALTLLCAVSAFRAGRWVVRRTGGLDRRSGLSATAVMAATYATTGLVVAALATHPSARTDLTGAFGGAAVLMILAGGGGVLTADPAAVRGGLPAWVRTVARGAAAVVLLLLATAAALLAVALVLDFGAAATVLSRLHADGPSGLMYTLVGIGFVPNAVVLAGTYLLGPGFLVGSGTLVSPTAVVLGPVPAFPLLAALPDDGATPSWAPWLIGVPVLLAATGAYLAGRSLPTPRYEIAAGRGLLTGLVAAGLFAGLAALASGAAGPGRMAEVGTAGPDVLLAGVTALAAGGLLGGAASAWAARRRARREGSTAGVGAH